MQRPAAHHRSAISNSMLLGCTKCAEQACDSFRWPGRGAFRSPQGSSRQRGQCASSGRGGPAPAPFRHSCCSLPGLQGMFLAVSSDDLHLTGMGDVCTAVAGMYTRAATASQCANERRCSHAEDAASAMEEHALWEGERGADIGFELQGGPASAHDAVVARGAVQLYVRKRYTLRTQHRESPTSRVIAMPLPEPAGRQCAALAVDGALCCG